MNSTNTMHANKITVWGSYQWGNFGDDLMAVMIALFLKSHGFRPIAYRLHPSIASSYDIETTQCLKDSLAGSLALVIGGGNFLGAVSQIDNDWVELEECISGHNIPIHFTSIGGDGSESPHVCPSAYRVLASNGVLSGTVRLKTDLPAFRSINPLIDRLHFYHDIVFGACSFFPATNASSERQHSIYNIGHSRGAKVIDLLSSSLQAIGRPAIRFASTHLESLTSCSSYANLRYEYASPKSSNNIIYNDIQSYVNLVSSAYFVASSKLHLGVAAMSYGVPFISINGATKTLACMRQIGFHDSTLSCNLSNPAQLPKLFLEGTMHAKAAKQNKRLMAITQAKNDSNGHWENLLEFLGRI